MLLTCWETLGGAGKDHSYESCQNQTNQTNLQTKYMTFFSNLEEIDHSLKIPLLPSVLPPQPCSQPLTQASLSPSDTGRVMDPS